MKDFRGDALFDPVYGTTVDQLDLRGVSVVRTLTELQFTINVRKLENLQQGLTKTGAAAVEYVARWTGPAVEDPDTGTKNPIYYAAVEVLPSGL